MSRRSTTASTTRSPACSGGRRAGWERFHLVGYSGGGAAALATAARHPGRLLSLGLLEPAWAGDWEMGDAERALWRELEKLEGLPPDEFMARVRPARASPRCRAAGARARPAAPWMANRPAGIRAFMRAFKTSDLDRESLSRFRRPVYYALGGLSHPDLYGALAERLSRVFDDFTLEVFEERHHFDPPHRIEPERLARSLRALGACRSRPAVTRRNGLGRRPDLDEAVRA